MDRNQSINIYAFLIILTGIILLLRGQYSIINYDNYSLANSHYPVTYIVSVLMLLSAGFAAYTAFQSFDFKLALKYHALHAFALVVYGLAVLFFANNLQKFLDITTFFLLFYGVSEIVFGFQLLLMRQKTISSQIVVFRLLIGFFISLGAVSVLASFYSDPNSAVLISGVVFVFSGINLILFRTVQKAPEKGM